MLEIVVESINAFNPFLGFFFIIINCTANSKIKILAYDIGAGKV